MSKRKKSLIIFAGALAGGLAGYLYWKYIGCVSGTCMITSKPLNSTIYFAVMGVLLVNMLLPSPGESKNTVR